MNKKVVLVHGYSKNKKDMTVLKKNLEYLGYEAILADLPLTFNSIEYATEVFEEQMDNIISNLKDGEKIDMVGHSTGGIVIRLFLSNNMINTYYENKISRSVLIATPNNGSELANITFKRLHILSKIFKTLDSLKTENIEKLLLKKPNYTEIGAIAGNNSNSLLGKLLRKPNDGRVEISSVMYDGLKDFIVLPYGHTEIHYKVETAKFVDAFLKKGKFT